MPLHCPSCGTEASGGKFCAGCGKALPQTTTPPPQVQTPPPVQPPPQFQPPPPVQPPPQFQPPPHVQPPFPGQPRAPYGSAPAPGPARKFPWVWAAVGGTLVALLGVLVVFLGKDDPPVAPVTPAAPTAPATPDTPSAPVTTPKAPAAPTTGKLKLTQVAKGTLSSGGRGQFYGAYDQYLGEGLGSKAIFYKFDDKGAVTQLSAVDDPQAGQLLDISVGDMLNAGTPVMVATFEKTIYVVPPGGQAQAIPNSATQRILMGDYDGDGKIETVFLGERGFNVYRYTQGGSTQPIYGKKDAVSPLPLVWPTRQKAGNIDLLYGYVFEGSDLFLQLYKWDGLGGPKEIGRYPVTDPDNVQWGASGPLPVGPAFAVGRRDGSIEILTIANDAASATSIGSAMAEGTGMPAVILSSFTGKKGQLLSVDDQGKYTLYDVGTK